MKNHGILYAAAAVCLLSCGHAAAQQKTPLPALQASVARGDVSAIMQLATRYEYAEGVAQDYAKSNELYCKAAALGSPQAEVRLGLIYSSGRAVIADEGVAAELFSRAAARGDAQARELLLHVSRRAETVMPACLDQAPPVFAAPDSSKDNAEIAALVEQLAPQYSVDPKLVMAVIATESSFNAQAVSPKNAQGLMQLIPATAQRFGVKQSFDIVENLKGGLAYLQWLMAFFKGDVSLVLAAYNAGEQTVERYRGIPPYAETRAYVKKITSVYKTRVHPYLGHITTPAPYLNSLRRSY